MTTYAISAGSGIDYLMSTVVSGDKEIKSRDLAGYWSQGGDTPGVWMGAQAGALGLHGTVTQEAADAIYKYGVDPASREPLGRRWPTYPTADEVYESLLAKEPAATEARRIVLRKKANKAGERTARAGWENVFSPVKSWSVLWGVSDDTTRAQMEEAEAAAFAKVWAKFEERAAWTRIGPGGVAQVGTQGLIASAFIHRSSRAGDPDYHRHVATSAKVQTADEHPRWLALDARPLHYMTVGLSEMYTTELEREMWERFGILAAPRDDSIRPDKRPVREYVGVSSSTVHVFSQRRRQTEKALKKFTKEFREREGREPSRAEQYALAQAAALTERPDKEPHSAGDERRQWRRRLWREGIPMPAFMMQAAKMASRALLAKRPTPPPLAEVADAIVAVLEQDRETWTRDNVEAEAYRQLTASGWHLSAGARFDTVLDEVIDHVLSPERCELTTPPEPLTVPSRYQRLDGTSIFVQVGSARYTSHRIKAWERDIVDAANTPTTVRRLTVAQVDAAVAAGDAERGFTPSGEQLEAVRRVFTGDTRAKAVIGPAGTGKTTIMRLVKEVADAHGIQVLGLARGQAQADSLAEAGGFRAENIARWRIMSEVFARGKPHWTLKRNTIVIIDESGQASTPDLHAILQQVEEAGGRMLPTGDPRQLGAPGVGGALALLESDSDVIYLTEVRRFRSVNGDLRHWEIDAATAISRGDAEASWEAYSARGRLHVGTLDEMADKTYTDWLADVDDGLSSVMIVPTNALAAELSDRARNDRVAAGIVDDSRVVTLPDGNRVGAGDQIVTRANNRELTCETSTQYVRNGDVWTVERVHRDGSLLVAHVLTRGRVVLPADYTGGGGVQLGYAVTKDRIQGATVQTSRSLLVPGMNANSVYPSMTRATLENHGYIATDGGVDVESGEPGRPVTGHQAWSAMVGRDGTQLSATARQRQAYDLIEAVRTHAPRMRFVLDDIADDEAKRAIIALMGEEIGELVTTAPAWPALRSQLTRLADEGLDTDVLVKTAHEGREWDGVIRDYARIMHSRVRLLLEDKDGNPIPGAAERYALPEDAERPLTAPTYEEDPQATGADFFAAYGLRLPAADVEGRDDRHEFVDEMVQLVNARVDHLAHQAQADAQAGEGWAAAYGPQPETVAEAVAWLDQVTAAAVYRDLADYTAADPVGPAPTEDEPQLRGLWRAAQQVPQGAMAYGHALQLAGSGVTWLDGIGAAPRPGDPARMAWVAAVNALDTYRTLWEYGHETIALGQRPADPVQAADYDAAADAVTAYRMVRQIPSLADADADTLAVIVARGNDSEPAAQAAAVAIARYDAAVRAQTAAVQAAEDAANRAVEARAATGDQVATPGRLAELDREADRARTAAAQARTETRTARNEVDAAAPGAVEARERMHQAAQARRALAHRRLNPSPDENPGPAQPSPFGDRPHGGLTDPELVAAAQRSVTEAVAIERAAPPTATEAQQAAVAAQAAAELREHAAELRAEYATRAVMEPDQLAAEEAGRLAARQRSAEARLQQAHQDTTSPEALHAERGRTAAVQATEAARRNTEEPDRESTPAKSRRPRRDPDRAPRNAAEARLQAASADPTSPEALQDARRKSRSAPATRSQPVDQPNAARKKPDPAAPKSPAKRRNSAASRLDAAESYGQVPPRPGAKGRQMPAEDPRRRRPDPPRSPGSTPRR